MTLPAEVIRNQAERLLSLGAEQRGLTPTDADEMDRVHEALHQGARELQAVVADEDEAAYCLAWIAAIVGLRYSHAELREIVRAEADAS